jgi:hypothetical protein
MVAGNPINLESYALATNKKQQTKVNVFVEKSRSRNIWNALNSARQQHEVSGRIKLRETAFTLCSSRRKAYQRG